MSIVVVAVNAAPVAGDATFTTLRDTAVSGTLTVTDPSTNRGRPGSAVSSATVRATSSTTG